MFISYREKLVQQRGFIWTNINAAPANFEFLSNFPLHVSRAITFSLSLSPLSLSLSIYLLAFIDERSARIDSIKHTRAY